MNYLLDTNILIYLHDGRLLEVWEIVKVLPLHAQMSADNFHEREICVISEEGGANILTQISQITASFHE